MTSDARGAPELRDIPPPSDGIPLSLSGPRVPPQQRIYFYSSTEWEQFILEWAIGLDRDYVQVKLLGGPGDEGIDVAGMKTEQQLEGPWDCFQGKHYARPLAFGDVATEIVKLFTHVIGGDYMMPDAYYFLAPRECSNTLNRLLSKPSQIRDKFISELAEGNALVSSMSEELIQQLRDLSTETDFSMFRSVELHEALVVHARTRFHVGRFGTDLPARSEVNPPPDQFRDDETTYVTALHKVYIERSSDGLGGVDGLADHPRFGAHFKRQRFSFFSAESLRMDVRDAVPDGTFEALQSDVHSGVVETAESPHPSGYDRLTAVLSQATSLNLSGHPLVSLTRTEDVKGICHQLANDSRLTWTELESP